MKQKRSRRRARGGFSLAEALVTLLIMSLLTSAAGLGVSQALYQRSESIALADAQNVAATAAQVITDQLRYGQIGPVESDGAIALSSGVYKMPIVMGLDSQGRLITQGVTKDADSGDPVRGKVHAMLGEEAYCGLELSELTFTVDQTGEDVNAVDVSLSVVKAGETERLWQLEFSVAPINRQAFSL